MHARPRPPRIALIGCGPRGLAAAEMALDQMPSCRIDIFEPSATPAAGPNYAPEESPHCLLNLRAEEVTLPFPERIGFSDWIAQTSASGPTPQEYPPRRVMGQYLNARFTTLQQAYPGAIRHHRQIATRATRDAAGWWIETQTNAYGPYDELVLTMGQPVTRADPTWASWRAQTAACGALMATAYPGHALQRKARGWAGKTVALRGLGLAALDVVALLTLGQGGEMAGERYLRSGREPARILPFSLDGVPPLPKPARMLQPRFALRDTETAQLHAAIARALTLDPDAAVDDIAQALEAPARRISGAAPTDWLRIERDSPGAQDAGRPPRDLLHEGIEMAAGCRPAGVGYCIGQIWRSLQPALRRSFLTADSRPDTRAAVLAFDRGLKRLTYGPPLGSARLLLALVQDGLVQLTLADDPAIRLTAQGWALDRDTQATVMIDAVLPPPRLDRIDDPLITALLREGGLREAPATGGIDVDATGCAAPGLTVLGRMTEGRSIAADSLLDCYGTMTRAWGERLAQAQRAPATQHA